MREVKPLPEDVLGCRYSGTDWHHNFNRDPVTKCLTCGTTFKAYTEAMAELKYTERHAQRDAPYGPKWQFKEETDD